MSQDKRLFRFPITLGHYHVRAPANILYLLPTCVRVLFNSWGWNRALCSQDVIPSPAAGEVSSEPALPPVVKREQQRCPFHTARAECFILEQCVAAVQNGPIFQEKEKSNIRILKIAHFLSF